MHDIQKLLIELDQLKSVYRRAYLANGSRNENSAEHSWHLAMALLALEKSIPLEIDVNHAVRIALVHDVCEIGAGDISIFATNRPGQAQAEGAYMSKLASEHKGFALDIQSLWHEYEKQETPESRWVKVVDRLLPFIMNLATEGKTWKEQNIKRSQVISINQMIAGEAPRIYEWMTEEIDKAVQLGWLKNS